MQTYPRDSVQVGNLGAVSAELGKWEKRDEDLEALQLQPNDEISYVNLAAAYMALDRLDEAEAVCKQAEERKLESEFLPAIRCVLAFLKGDGASMARFASSAVGKAGAEDLFLALQADTEAWYGRLRNAAERAPPQFSAQVMCAGKPISRCTTVSKRQTSSRSSSVIGQRLSTPSYTSSPSIFACWPDFFFECLAMRRERKH
jgi:hypothetical protein